MKFITVILLFYSFLAFGQIEDCELPVYFSRNPEFKGGNKMIKTFITNNLIYPKAAERANVEGKVFVKFRINKRGKVDNITVTKSVGFGCDEEAIRIIKLTNKKWISAKKGNKRVSAFCTLPINFNFDE